MASINIPFANGTTKVATVPDGMSDADMGSSAAAIHAAMLKEDPTLDHPAAPHAGTDGSLGTQLRAGAHDAGRGLQATAQTAAATAGPGAIADAANTARGFLGKYTPNMPANAADPSAEAIKAFQAGDYAKAASWLPAAGARSIPDLVAALGAGAITRSPAGTAAYLAARTSGEAVQGRQVNNGHSPDDAPTAGELGGGLAAAAAQTALGTLGLKVPGISKVPTAFGRGAVNVAAEGAAGAANDLVGQAGTSAGTDSGLHVDPYRVGMAGVAQMTARAASVVPNIMGAGGRALGDKISEIGVQKPTDAAQATAFKAADQAVKDVQARSTRGDMPYHEAANTARTQLAANMEASITASLKSGEISSDVAKAYREVIDTAKVHNRDLNEVPGGVLETIRENPLSGDRAGQFQDAASALNVLSTNARANRQSGYAQKVLGATGGFLSSVGGGYTGNPLGIIAGLAGHSAGNRIGSGVGRVIDNMLGSAGPDLPIQARLANRFLDKTGNNPDVQSPLVTSKGLVDSTPTQRENMGLPESPVTGVNDPATGRPFADIQSALAHSTENNAAVNYQDPTRHIRPSVITPDQIAALHDPRRASDSWLRGELSQRLATEQRGLAMSEGGAVDKILSKKVRSDLANDPQATWDRTNGNQGNPAASSDPMMVRADGTPIQPASQGPSRASPGPPTGQSASSPKEIPPQATQVPQAPPGGTVLPNTKWLNWQRQGFELQGHDSSSVTHANAVAAAHELVDAGLIPRDFAQRLETYHGPIGADRSNPAGDPMHLIQGRLAEKAGFPTMSVAANGSPPGGGPVAQAQAMSQATSGVKNPLSYQANLRQEQATASNIVASHPEMADAVNQLRDTSRNSKSKLGRVKVLQEILKDVPPDQRQTWATTLGPLAQYGQ